MTSEREKMKARRLVRDALKMGYLTRPDACNRCGVTPKIGSDGRSTIHGHHHDYTKPLDVEWICAKCHRAETPLPPVIGAPTYGERNGAAKLNETIILSARRLRASGWTYKRIADRFGVHKMTIMRALKGEWWKQIAAAPAPGGEK